MKETPFVVHVELEKLGSPARIRQYEDDAWLVMAESPQQAVDKVHATMPGRLPLAACTVEQFMEGVVTRRLVVGEATD
jgi:hypothetical protein